MKKRELVAHIMTDELVTVNLKNSLRDVKKIFSERKLRHLPVVEEDRLVGMVSRTDMMRLSFGNLFDNQEHADEAMLDMLNIEQVMAHHPVTVSPEMTIREAAQILTEKEFHALPVVDGSHLKGIVTTTDVIQYLLQQY